MAKSIPPYSIYAGGKIIGYRFSQDIIDKLNDISYDNLSLDYISNNIEQFYTHVDQNNIEKIISTISEGRIENG